jgi:hypothetical protein
MARLTGHQVPHPLALPKGAGLDSSSLDMGEQARKWRVEHALIWLKSPAERIDVSSSLPLLPSKNIFQQACRSRDGVFANFLFFPA